MTHFVPHFVPPLCTPLSDFVPHVPQSGVHQMWPSVDFRLSRPWFFNSPLKISLISSSLVVRMRGIGFWGVGRVGVIDPLFLGFETLIFEFLGEF